jgi:hypothetical protein
MWPKFETNEASPNAKVKNAWNFTSMTAIHHHGMFTRLQPLYSRRYFPSTLFAFPLVRVSYIYSLDSFIMIVTINSPY